MTFAMDIVGTVLILLGALIFLIAGIGLLRLPDLYTRISAITTAASVGLALILIGVLLYEPSPLNAVKAILAVIVNLMTASLGGHALGRAGYLTGAPLSRYTHFDELSKN